MNRLQEKCERVGLRINTNKTEVLRVTKINERLPVEISSEGRLLSQVSSFRYLGDLISEDDRSDKEIEARIGLTKPNFGKMRKFSTNLSLNRQLKKESQECYV